MENPLFNFYVQSVKLPGNETCHAGMSRIRSLGPVTLKGKIIKLNGLFSDSPARRGYYKLGEYLW